MEGHCQKGLGNSPGQASAAGAGFPQRVPQGLPGCPEQGQPDPSAGGMMGNRRKLNVLVAGQTPQCLREVRQSSGHTGYGLS